MAEEAAQGRQSLSPSGAKARPVGTGRSVRALHDVGGEPARYAVAVSVPAP